MSRYFLALLGIWIFADTYCVAYLNSFYSDAAALLALLLLVPLALWAARNPDDIRPVILCCPVGILFMASKTQHAAFAWLFAAGAVALAVRAPKLRVRIAASVLSLSIVGAAVWSFAESPREYAAISLFNVIFTRLAKNASDPARVLVEMGLDQSETRLVGLTAFSPGSPVGDPSWRGEFLKRTGYGRLLRYYLTHPAETQAYLTHPTETQAFQIHPLHPGIPVLLAFARYRIEVAKSPLQRATKFASWSLLRSKLLERWPWHIVVWFVGVFAACFWRLARKRGSSYSRRATWVCLLIALFAAGEYFLTVLVDSQETFRHLFIFHVATDVTVLFAAAAALERMGDAKTAGMYLRSLTRRTQARFSYRSRRPLPACCPDTAAESQPTP